MRDVSHGAVLVKGFLVFPLFDVRDPPRIVHTLVEFIADAAGLLVSGLHQRVHGGDESIRFAFLGAKFRHADDYSGFFLDHDRLLLGTAAEGLVLAASFFNDRYSS